jgi:hypothetical protein
VLTSPGEAPQGPKQRFVDKADHHDLDLVYLTDRIVLVRGRPRAPLSTIQG